MEAVHVRLIAKTQDLSEKQVAATLRLLEEGATIPFIARYRKEATGELDEVQVAEIQRAGKQLTELEARRETVLSTIADQGKLTPELEQRIRACYNPTELEDIYLPYRPKRRTRATMAREKGLEPLADQLWAQNVRDVEGLAEGFLTDEVPTVEEALQGARDIMAERIAEDDRARNRLRHHFRKGAIITSKVARGKEKEGEKYRDYFDFQESLAKCPSHRLLAIRRGEDEGFLRVIIEPEAELVLPDLQRLFLDGHGPATEQVRLALEDGYQRLLAPSIETEFR
ncbi:MAG: RNA-binding transcriptional accessory protein, partial [Lewinella sp.]|nr:RNA-binding transcriptional accessory protein [Lewinella sp.]